MNPECTLCLLYIIMATLGQGGSRHYHMATLGQGGSRHYHADTNRKGKGEQKTIQETYMAKTPILPTFLTTPGDITVNKGDEAVLPCAVEHRGTRTVVWRMAHNPNPLTIGVKPFVKNNKYKVAHPKHSLEWNLHILNAQPEDSGVYVCQVSSVKRGITQNMNLTVRDMPGGHRRKQVRPYKSKIPLSSEITIRGSFFVEKGDTLKLQCNATGSEYHPDEIDWFKDGNKIKNSDRITLDKHVSLSDHTITSSLLIKRGHMDDAGTYVCRTSDLQVTSVNVNVLNTDTNKKERADIMAHGHRTGETRPDAGGGGCHVVSTGSSLMTILLSFVFVVIMSSRHS